MWTRRGERYPGNDEKEVVNPETASDHSPRIDSQPEHTKTHAHFQPEDADQRGTLVTERHCWKQAGSSDSRIAND